MGKVEKAETKKLSSKYLFQSVYSDKNARSLMINFDGLISIHQTGAIVTIHTDDYGYEKFYFRDELYAKAAVNKLEDAWKEWAKSN